MFSNRIQCLLLASLQLSFACATVRAQNLIEDKPRLSPATLPGNGLKQHDFFYAGESPLECMYVVRDGAIAWSYTHNGKGEISDAVILPNGNIWIAHQFGITEISPDRKVLWNYDAPKGTEIHTLQLLENDKIAFVQNGDPAKVIVMDCKTQAVLSEFQLQLADRSHVHPQVRRLRLTSTGTFLISHMDRGMAVEYTQDGKILRIIQAPGIWSAEPLANGNMLITSRLDVDVKELDPKGKIVWEFTAADAPEYSLFNLQTATRLANGNTLITQWLNGWSTTVDPSNAPVQALEVTPDKHVAWALRAWSPPADLGPSTNIQILP